MSTAIVPVRRWSPGAVQVAARVGLGGVLLWAGLTKVTATQEMVLAVDAYDVLPEALVRPVATALPWVEVALGLFLVLGLFVRFSAAASAALLVVFLAGMAQAKARGLAIDCGCFGGGGAGEGVSWLDILRDVGFLAVAGFLVARPLGPWSLDERLATSDTNEEE